MKRILAMIAAVGLVVAACGTSGSSSQAQAQDSRPKRDGTREHPCNRKSESVGCTDGKMAYYVETPDGKSVLCAEGDHGGVTCNWEAFNKLS